MNDRQPSFGEPGWADALLKRLLTELNANSVKELASILDVGESTLYRNIKDNTAPFQRIVEYCLENRSSLDALLYGQRKTDRGLLLDTTVNLVRMEQCTIPVGSSYTQEELETLQAIRDRSNGTASWSAVMFKNISDACPDIASPGEDLVADLFRNKSQKTILNSINDGDCVLFLNGSHLLLRRLYIGATTIKLSAGADSGLDETLTITEFENSIDIVGRVIRVIRYLTPDTDDSDAETNEGSTTPRHQALKRPEP